MSVKLSGLKASPKLSGIKVVGFFFLETINSYYV